MKTLNFLKQLILAFAILMCCSFNNSNVSDEKANELDKNEWETCIREASGKIASSYAKSILIVEYEYSDKDLKAMTKKKNSKAKTMNVKLKVHWTIDGENHSIEGKLKTNSECCNATWQLTKSSSKKYKKKDKLDLGCVTGSSTGSQDNMGVGKPFVRKRSKS